MKTRINAAPLSVWLLCLPILVVFTSIIHTVILVNPPPPETFTVFNTKRLLTLNSTDVHALKVVMLGDSRLRYGVFDDNTFSRLLSEKMGEQVTVVRVVKNWAVFQDFQGLEDVIFSLNPDLVVLQNSLFSKGKSPRMRYFLAKKFWFWTHFGYGAWDPGKEVQFALQYEMKCSALDVNESIIARKERVFTRFIFDEKAPSALGARDFLTKASKRQLPVLSVSVPVTPLAAKVLPSPVTTTPTAYYTDAIIDDENFCDSVHMNAQGREIYSTWLAELISARLTPKYKDKE